MRLIAITLVAMLAGTLSSAHARAELLAAAGKVEITPDHPVFLAGYASNRKSTGAHDPLWARCLVLKNGGETVALVSCDLIALSRVHTVKIRPMIRNVPADRVLIGATHTHSGPDTYGQWGPNQRTSGVDKEWIQGVYRKVAVLVDDTATKLQPATVAFGSTDRIEKCSYNARVQEILDATLSAMRVADRQGKTIATLVNYACHPEILNNHQITSDFPNWLRQAVEEKLGGVAIYMNGAQGGMITADIQNESSYPKGEAWPEAERIGKTLAEKAIGCLEGAKALDDAVITFAQRTYRVPLENEGFKMLMRAGVLPSDLSDGNDIVTEVSRFTLGPAEFVTLPGEVLPNIGLFLRRKMTGSPRFQLGLTGDALGYILTPEDFGLKLYRYETSVSVGSQMGRRMEENLLELIARKSAGTASR